MGNGNKNIIELNGQKYDATTGTLLGAATVPHQVTSVKVYPRGHTGRSLDVFTHASLKTKTPAKPSQPAPAATHVHVKVAPGAIRQDVVAPATYSTKHAPHQLAKHLQHHQQIATHTLMRSAVKRPGDSFKKQIHVQTELTRKVPSAIVPKTSAYSLNPERIKRSKTVNKSQHISRFAVSRGQIIRPHLLPSQIQAGPSQITQTRPVQPDIAAPKPHPTNKPIDIFEHAMASAEHFVDTSAARLHFEKKLRRHAAVTTAGVLVLTVMAGFLVYQNVPAVKLKVAAYRAGMQASMPNFKAAGFAFDKVIAEQPQQLTIGFAGGGETYRLTQQPTNWTDDEMIASIASHSASGQPNYSVIQNGDTTIYRLTNTSATWVAGGTWYQVNGTGSLSDYQLKNLANNI